MVGPVRRGGKGIDPRRTMDRPNSSRNQGPNGSDQDQNGSDGSRVHEGVFSYDSILGKGVGWKYMEFHQDLSRIFGLVQIQ